MMYDIINYIGTIIALLVVTTMIASFMLKFFKCETTLTNIYGGVKESETRAGRMMMHFGLSVISTLTILIDLYGRRVGIFNASTTLVLIFLGITVVLLGVVLVFSTFSSIREHIKEK